MEKYPKVSICMITYGHEKFIEEAVNGVLMQECDFEIELVIVNDCSPDNTDLIIQNILNTDLRASKIKYIKHNKNLGMMPNFVFAMGKCDGDYVAFCEGDDYWNDPLKLQQQVRFLEAHADYVMSHHDIHVVDENRNHMRDSKYYNLSKLDHTKEQLVNSPYILPVTMCFRNVITDFPKEFLKVLNGDMFFISMLGQHGKSKFQEDIRPSSYRIHLGGVSSMISDLDKEYQKKNTYFQLFSYYSQRNANDIITYNFLIKHKNSVLRLLKRMIQEKEKITSFKLYMEFLFKCFKFSLWRESIYITIDYLKLIKDNFKR